MEGEGLEGFFRVGDGCGEGFDDEADDGAEAEALTAVGPWFFEHGGETSGHGGFFVDLVEVFDDGEFDAAPE